jgi:hypothetical protein
MSILDNRVMLRSAAFAEIGPETSHHTSSGRARTEPMRAPMRSAKKQHAGRYGYVERVGAATHGDGHHVVWCRSPLG